VLIIIYKCSSQLADNGESVALLVARQTNNQPMIRFEAY